MEILVTGNVINIQYSIYFGIDIVYFRKNAAHRVELTHPGDSDYDTDPNDTRPICCYGVNCYRKNKEHRKRLRHPGQKKLGTKPPSQRKSKTSYICIHDCSIFFNDFMDFQDDNYCSDSDYESDT